MSLLLILSLIVFIYIQVGYSCIIWILGRLFPIKNVQIESLPDGITIVLCVHNGAALIQQRLRNLDACFWEGEREILVYCDGCTDETALKAQNSGVDGVRVTTNPTQLGKWAALNQAIKSATHRVIIFADARQTFDPNALILLAKTFQNPKVGAVSGLLEISASGKGGGRGVDLYWRMERKLREWEARFDSVIGCTGAIYAIRKDLFTELRPGTLLDDVVVPMQIAMKGWRIAYEPLAKAFDPQSLDPKKESDRKLRTLVGNYQMIENYPEWLLPWRNRLWCQLLSHKYARLMVPWLMIMIALLTVTSAFTPAICCLLIGQIFCYGLGILGCLFPQLRARFITIPAGFLLLQWSCARALFTYLRCRQNPLSLWKPSTPGKNG